MFQRVISFLLPENNKHEHEAGFIAMELNALTAIKANVVKVIWLGTINRLGMEPTQFEKWKAKQINFPDILLN